ncbi:glutamyl-tRNA synthetase-like protein [Chaetomium sp. MPI-CAGE-AT-0009]|nr:glutamyl-tRNA synthetase-like protein [Chaetomium sp. MPI-CAGE-AT-0009]
MEILVLRGRGLWRRPLLSGCPRWRPVSQSLQRLSFSTTSRLTTDSVERSSRDKTKLPDTPCRTRFAPSPTGYLHLGSLRTALFNHLLARATGGQFVLRIEDTDRSRLVPDAEDRLYKDLKWAGLSWDEGPDIQGPYGPYRQSERLPLYQEHADKLLREGKAYRCFCSPEALEQHKKEAHESGQPTLYPGTCRHIPLEESDDRAHKGEEFAIRFKSAEEPLMIRDIIYNRFKKKDPEDDYIIMKRDGFPTYHFANVVDDRHMKITHVIRGAEWLVSTPKHVELYQAFGWEPPEFAHLGLLVDKNRQKLSKRDNSASMEYYQSGHILPSALLNFAVLLGWRAPPAKGDVMTLEEMVENFSLKFSKGDIIVSLQKLPFLQDKHLTRIFNKDTGRTPAEQHTLEREFLQPLQAAIEQVQQAKDEGLPLAPGGLSTSGLGSRVATPLILREERYRGDLARLALENKLPLESPAERFSAAVGKLRYYIWDVPADVLEQAVRGGALDPVVPAQRAGKLSHAIGFMAEKFRAVGEVGWNREGIEGAMNEIMADSVYQAFFEAETPQANLYTPLRWALLEGGKGLPMWTTIEILGRNETLRRLKVAELAAERAAVPLAEKEA